MRNIGVINMIFWQFGAEDQIWRAGMCLESFLEVFCFNLAEHEPMRSHGEPIHAFLVKKACLLVEQEDMSSCWTRRHVFLFNRKTWPLAQQEDMSTCWRRRRHVLLLKKKTHPLVQQEDMSSCSTSRHVLLTIYGENRFTVDRHGLMFSQIEANHLQEAF